MRYTDPASNTLTQLFDEVIIVQHGQDLVRCGFAERNFGLREPRPVVRVGPPVVRVFVWKGKPVVNGGYPYCL